MFDTCRAVAKGKTRLCCQSDETQQLDSQQNFTGSEYSSFNSSRFFSLFISSLFSPEHTAVHCSERSASELSVGSVAWPYLQCLEYLPCAKTVEIAVQSDCMGTCAYLDILIKSDPDFMPAATRCECFGQLAEVEHFQEIERLSSFFFLFSAGFTLFKVFQT